MRTNTPEFYEAVRKAVETNTLEFYEAVRKAVERQENGKPICPETGSFIAWKQARTPNGEKCVVKLYVPAEAYRVGRSSLRNTCNKCRCNMAIVMSIMTSDGQFWDKAYSRYDSSFVYEIGQLVAVPGFSADSKRICGTGIHFFMSKEEAWSYDFT